MEKEYEGSLYSTESEKFGGGSFRYGPDTKCIKGLLADLSVVEVIHLGSKEECQKLTQTE